MATTEKLDRPRDGDAVLGGENPVPSTGLVLGGMEGVKKRFASAVAEHRVAAVKDAIKYGKSGLEIIIEALRDESDLVQRSAYLLLQKKTNAEGNKALESFNHYRFFECRRTLKVGTQIAISPNGEIVATLASKGGIKVGNLHRGELLYKIPKYPRSQQVFLIDYEGKFLVRSINSASNFVEVWEEGELQHTLYGHENEIRAIAISPNRQILATGSLDKSIKIWNLKTGRLIFNISSTLIWGTHTGTVLCLAFTPDGETLVSASADGTIKVWNLRNRDKPRTFRMPFYGFFSLEISPNGQIIAAACYDGRIRLLHFDTGEVIHTLEQLPWGVNCLAFSPDGRTLASGGNYDKTIKLWNVQTGEELHTLTGHDNCVSCLAFSSDGQTLVSGSLDKTLKVWGIQ